MWHPTLGVTHFITCVNTSEQSFKGLFFVAYHAPAFLYFACFDAVHSVSTVVGKGWLDASTAVAGKGGHSEGH